MEYSYTRKTIPLHAISLSLRDVRTIFERLSKHVSEEADREIRELVKPDSISDSDWQEKLTNLRKDTFRVTVSIAGSDGEEVHDDRPEIFASYNLPKAISSIYMTNITAYELVTKRKPSNRFTLHLDFSKPRLLDTSNPVTAPTPNFSNLTIEGDRDSWVASISDAVVGMTSRNRNGKEWIHRVNVYDLGVFTIGIPAAFYLCAKIAPFFPKALTSSMFLSSAAYVYIVLAALWGFQLIFRYTRWAFPLVELKESEDAATRHRQIWLMIVIGIIASVLADLLI